MNTSECSLGSLTAMHSPLSLCSCRHGAKDYGVTITLYRNWSPSSYRKLPLPQCCVYVDVGVNGVPHPSIFSQPYHISRFQENSTHENSTHENSSHENSTHENSTHENSSHENSTHENSTHENSTQRKFHPRKIPPNNRLKGGVYLT